MFPLKVAITARPRILRDATHCDATHLHLGLMDLLLPLFHVQFYVSGHRLFLYMHILHMILSGRLVKKYRISEHRQHVFL